MLGHTSWVLSIAWSPDGKTLASGGMDNTVGRKDKIAVLRKLAKRC